MSASMAIVMTPAQVRAFRKHALNIRDEINGNVVVYGEEVEHDIEVCWADHGGELHTVFILPDGTTQEGSEA